MTDIEKMVNQKFDHAMQDKLTHCAMKHDMSGSPEPFIEAMERLLHYLGITAVTAARDDEDLRNIVTILHERIDDVVCKVAADARKHQEKRNAGRPE